jgi:hypothetical protein
MSDENTQSNETATNGANGAANGTHHDDPKPTGAPGGGKKKKHKRNGKPAPETSAKVADAATAAATTTTPEAPEAVTEASPMEQFQSEDRLHAPGPRAPITFLDMPPEIPSTDSLATQEPPVPTIPEPSPEATEPSPEVTATTADTPAPSPQKTAEGLRLRMKVWTDSKTGKRYLMPAAFMRDVVKGQPVSDAMYAYAMSDDSTKLVTLTAREWNSLPFFYFQEDGPAPRATAWPVDVIR